MFACGGGGEYGSGSENGGNEMEGVGQSRADCRDRPPLLSIVCLLDRTSGFTFSASSSKLVVGDVCEFGM